MKGYIFRINAFTGLVVILLSSFAFPAPSVFVQDGNGYREPILPKDGLTVIIERFYVSGAITPKTGYHWQVSVSPTDEERTVNVEITAKYFDKDGNEIADSTRATLVSDLPGENQGFLQETIKGKVKPRK